ncbi:armadillo-type protein [Baffinella frigidus]|nr:armadillo-type protein [Cryptophyta sp. CCMP2293]
MFGGSGRFGRGLPPVFREQDQRVNHHQSSAVDECGGADPLGPPLAAWASRHTGDASAGSHIGISHQPSSWSQIALFISHDLYWRSPESGDQRYKSRVSTTRSCSHSQAGGPRVAATPPSKKADGLPRGRRELIRAVRACKTLADERDAIAKECAAIRTAFKDEDNPYRHRNVAKLLFIHMLGYPTHFGQMECLKLIAGHRFPEKRIGYLGLMLLLDEDTEVLMLVTNSLKNDLGHTNQFIVEKLLTNTNAYIRKKAVLALLRILRKCPDMVEHYLEKITSLLSDRNHGVLVGTLAMLIEVCETQPEVVPSFRACAPQLLKMLKNLVLSGYAPEHDVSGITDPFEMLRLDSCFQVKILRALRILAAGNKGTSEAIADLLAQVATNTESAKNAGNAILYECVLTIVGIEADSGLRVLAVNILGRFLLNRDNNIRYVGLNTLAQVAGADLKAIQRHRGTVVDCLKDPDISIRRRALDLVYLLVNGTNVKPLPKP